jgi:aerobic carbon-monoxide dehydrogenase medium subunit
MKLSRFQYYAPDSLDEALSVLQEKGRSASLLAGGTDLMPLIKARKTAPHDLINIKGIEGLRGFKSKPNVFCIGPLTTMRQIEKSESVLENLPILQKAASSMAYVQIRNLGTIGGNIANASPAADFAPPLMVLDASIELASAKERRKVSINRFFVGPGKTVARDSEMVTKVSIPVVNKMTYSYFRKIPSGISKGLSVASIAMLIFPSERDASIEEIRIAVGAMAPTPIRCPLAERKLTGEKLSANLIDEVSEMIASETQPITDVRSSKEYRTHVLKCLTKEGLTKFFERCSGVL